MFFKKRVDKGSASKGKGDKAEMASGVNHVRPDGRILKKSVENTDSDESNSSMAAAGTTPEPVSYYTPFPFSGEKHVESGHVYSLGGKRECYIFRNFADSLDSFNLCYHNNDVLVWDKKISGEPMHVIKVFGIFRESTPRELYDLLQDAVFREEWDTFRQEAFCIARLNLNNDIGYYAAKSPIPLVANRDFVNQRVWHNAGRDEYVIFNTSVPHTKVPKHFQRKERHNANGKFVRGISKITGYLIRPWTNPQTGEREGACLTYITQSDPRGHIPSAITNYITSKFAPSTIKTVGQALKKFKVWLTKRLESGTYVKEWDMEPQWWLTPEEERANPVKNITINFARDYFKEPKKKL